MPPTQISGSPWQSAWNSTTTPKLAPTASTFAVGVGDLIVVEANNAGAEGTFSTPTNAAGTSPASITWTQQGNVGTSGVNSRATSWTGVVTAAGNVQVSVVRGGTAVAWGMIVWAFNSHGGVGQTIATTGSSTAPSATPASAWTAHSTVCCANADWNAASWGATRSYRTNLGTATERNYANVDSNYTTGAWEHTDSGASPGSGAVGFTTPTMKWSLVAVEVLPPAGGTTTVSGSDTGAGTDAGSVSATDSGSDSAAGSDAGTVSATVASSDSGSSSEAGSLAISQPVTGSDSGSGSETSAASAMVPGADSGSGSESGTVGGTGGGADIGAGADAGAVSASVGGADSGTGTDAGIVTDITGGPTPVSGSDSGGSSEAGTVVDLTPPVETGPSGGRYEPGGDESSIYGEPPRRLSDRDEGRAFELAAVVDLTPARPRRLRVKLPKPVKRIAGQDAALAVERALVSAATSARDTATATEAGNVYVTADPLEDAELAEVMTVLGLLSD